MNQRNVYEGSLTPELNPLAMERENPFLAGSMRLAFSEFIGQSDAMEKLFQTVGKVARADTPVLIHGESGTGKELIAKALHRLSNRASGPFLAINCAAIPENLLESQLFGYEKGAFTGADRKASGYFQAAAGGTLFLDEIGEMPLILQAKILRVLQEKQYHALGSPKPTLTDVRIITATNVDLEKAVKARQFREDLFFRLNVLPVNVPALRDRRGDIRLLLDYYLNLSNQSQGYIQPSYFSPDAISLLERHNWPGNVRELQNLVERLVVMTGGGMIGAAALPDAYRQLKPGASSVEMQNPMPKAMAFDSDMVGRSVDFNSVDILPVNGIDLESYIEQLENTLIMQALERTGNNKNQAAKLLGLNRTTLVERIKKRKLVALNAPSKEL